MLVHYINDIMLSRPGERKIATIKGAIVRHMPVRDLSHLWYFLGIQWPYTYQDIFSKVGSYYCSLNYPT